MLSSFVWFEKLIVFALVVPCDIGLDDIGLTGGGLGGSGIVDANLDVGLCR